MNRREFLPLAAAFAFARPARAAPTVPRPKKSLILTMLPKELSLADRFAMAKRAGFEGIEIPPTYDPVEQAALRAAADKTALPIHSIIFGHQNKPLTHPDPAVRAESLDLIAKGLHCAKAVGADNLLLIPAVVNENTRYIDAYTRSQDGVRKLIPLAEKLQVTLAIEEVWNNFLLSPLEFARFIDDFKSRYVQAYFDVGNIVKNGWPEDWIRTLGKRIVRVHLKDFVRKEHKWVPLGEGDVNWKEVRKALAEVGFTNYMTAELDKGDEVYLTDVAARIDKIIAGA